MGAATLAVEAQSKTKEFEAVALVHLDSIYKLALYMSENESDAQDLVQDTYLRAYRFFDRFETGTNCKAWLMTILKNTFINTVRRGKRHPQIVHLSEMEDWGIDLPGDEDPEEDVFKDTLDDDVTAALEALPADYRAVVLLSDMEGLSYKEIAEILDCPIGTVMSRLHRGRRLLRKRLRYYAAQYGYPSDR